MGQRSRQCRIAVRREGWLRFRAREAWTSLTVDVLRKCYSLSSDPQGNGAIVEVGWNHSKRPKSQIVSTVWAIASSIGRWRCLKIHGEVEEGTGIEAKFQCAKLNSAPGSVARESNVAAVSTSAAKHFPVSDHLALVEDFLSAAGAIHSNTGPGDQRF